MKQINILVLLFAVLKGGHIPYLFAEEYTLTVENNSSNAAYITLFQTDPEIGVAEVQSLAWLSKYAYPGTTLVFKWQDSYSFIWGETNRTGEVILEAGQIIPADLKSGHSVKLSYDKQHAAYYFQTANADSPAGALIIQQGPDIPLRQAVVGIGMAGKAAFVVQAQPNITLSFIPRPKYWVTFGNYTEGEVVNVTQITHKAAVAFPPNVDSRRMRLNQDNSWSIKLAK